VAREVVDDPDVAAHGAEVGADGVHVVDAPEGAAVDGPLEVERARIVEEHVAHHQNPALFLGDGAQGARLGGVEGERLLAEHILARIQGLANQREMGLDGRGHDDRVNVGRLGHRPRVAAGLNARELPARQGQARFGAVADPGDLTALNQAEVADMIWAPLAKANHAHAHRGRG
jgi:hypothetical protein